MKRLLFPLMMLGCSGGAPAGGGSSGVDPRFGAQLEVEGSMMTQLNGRPVSPSGNPYVAARVVLSNHGSANLPLSHTLFSAEWNGRAYVAVNGDNCDGSSVLAGASASCSLVFDLPWPGTIAAVSYTLPDGSSLRAQAPNGSAQGAAACAAAADFNGCYTCCITTFPAGADFAYQRARECVCLDPGECGSACATEYCAEKPITSGSACDSCLHTSTCDPRPACRADADCSLFLGCYERCPGST